MATTGEVSAAATSASLSMIAREVLGRCYVGDSAGRRMLKGSGQDRAPPKSDRGLYPMSALKRARYPLRCEGTECKAAGKTALAVLRSLLFDFTNMKTGVCFPRVRTLQERLQPWYSRAARL